MNKIFVLSALMCMTATSAIAMPMHDKDHMGKKHMDYFDKADTNRDGKISRAENDAFADHMFNKADMNNDNVITRAEMDTHKMHHHDKMSMRSYPKEGEPYAVDTREYASGPAMMEDQMPINYSNYGYNYSPSAGANY